MDQNQPPTANNDLPQLPGAEPNGTSQSAEAKETKPLEAAQQPPTPQKGDDAQPAPEQTSEAAPDMDKSKENPIEAAENATPGDGDKEAVETDEKTQKKDKSKKPVDTQKVLNRSLAIAFIIVNLVVMGIIAYLFTYEPIPEDTATPTLFPTVRSENYEQAKEIVLEREEREPVNADEYSDPYKLDNQTPQPGNEDF